MISTELEKLPVHLKTEWFHVREWHSSISKDNIWKNFKTLWDIKITDDCCSLGPVAKEISEMSDSVYNQWKIWTKLGYKFHEELVSSLVHKNAIKIKDVNLSKILDSFKSEWDWDNPATSVMFAEMSHLSEKMLHEWYQYYDGDYGYIYSYTDGMTYDKTKLELWAEFTEEWGLEFTDGDYSEKYFNEMLEELKGICNLNHRMYKKWYDFLEDSNYHSYDSYPIKEQYEIWIHFKEEWDL